MDTLQHIVVKPNEVIGTIRPALHGHFAEHLGELVYPGIFVGPDSSIPNVQGLRLDVIEALKPLRIPVLRWPGGCFADAYHWRDGIGPAAERPVRVNYHWGQVAEPNKFGTHEFMAFCRAIGAEPYFAANVGSGTPAELLDWIEYCNYTGKSTLAGQRRANGADAPFAVSLWGIGNENWGCGGRMSPEEYAAAFSRYRVFAFDLGGTKTKAIACGPNSADWSWTRRFFDELIRYPGYGRLEGVQYYAAHYYTWSSAPAAVFDSTEWLRVLALAGAVEGIIDGHRSIMDEFDPDRKIGLILDEWGTWHHQEDGKPTSGLYQQNTMRDACVAAITLDIFNNNADKIVGANIAQLINVLQAVLLVEDDKCIKTPTYHVFDLYQPHKGAQAVRFESGAEIITDGGSSAEVCRGCYLDKRSFGLRAVQGSASVNDGNLCVTAVNTHPTLPVEVEIELHETRMETAQVVILADDIDAHNTFEQPNRVCLPDPITILSQSDRFRVELPPGAIVRLSGQMG